jgi:hypothetical protein
VTHVAAEADTIPVEAPDDDRFAIEHRHQETLTGLTAINHPRQFRHERQVLYDSRWQTTGQFFRRAGCSQSISNVYKMAVE